MKMRVTQSDIAGHLDLDPSRVSRWLAKNQIQPPYDLDGIRIAYIRDLREKAAGRYTEGDLDPQQERARKDRAMADKYERENAVAEGRLHKAEDVERLIAECNLRAKRRLLTIPRAIAVSVPRECAREAETEAERILYEALEELADSNEYSL